MTGLDRPGEASSPSAAVDPEAAYYQTIEEFFVSRRGDPLFLSNADWLLIRKWRAGAVPLRVVLRGIADALDAHAHSWSRDRKVGSLAYCAAEVEAARERWERALAMGGEEEADVPGVLRGFAQALKRARGLGSSAAPLAGDLARELGDRAGHSMGTRELEAWLAERERALLAALRSDAGGEELAGIESTVDEVLAPYLQRLPPRVLTRIRKESISRRLLEAHGIPRLSLFQA